jgi:two-component system, OmpR family, KDP operon response regulator KdpE
MARGPRIFIIDGDGATRTLLRRVLTAAGYRVQDGEPGQGAIGRIAESEFDLLILDVNSSADRGSEALPMVRELSAMPVLVLSTDEDTAVNALDHGADEYVCKPLRIKELLARIKNTLRRRVRQQGKPGPFVIGDLKIDLVSRRISSCGREVHLPVKLYEVLRVLAEGDGKVLTHQEILGAVWGARRLDRVHYLRVAIQELRRKLEPDPAHPQYILTETGVGYRLGPKDAPQAARGLNKAAVASDRARPLGCAREPPRGRRQ